MLFILQSQLHSNNRSHPPGNRSNPLCKLNVLTLKENVWQKASTKSNFRTLYFNRSFLFIWKKNRFQHRRKHIFGKTYYLKFRFTNYWAFPKTSIVLQSNEFCAKYLKQTSQHLTIFFIFIPKGQIRNLVHYNFLNFSFDGLFFTRIFFTCENN